MKAAVFAYFIQYCRHIVRSQAHSESGFSDTCLIPALPASIETQADLACVGIHESALPASIEKQADRAFTESALHFQFWGYRPKSV